MMTRADVCCGCVVPMTCMTSMMCKNGAVYATMVKANVLKINQFLLCGLYAVIWASDVLNE